MSIYDVERRCESIADSVSAINIVPHNSECLLREARGSAFFTRPTDSYTPRDTRSEIEFLSNLNATGDFSMVRKNPNAATIGRIQFA